MLRCLACLALGPACRAVLLLLLPPPPPPSTAHRVLSFERFNSIGSRNLPLVSSCESERRLTQWAVGTVGWLTLPL